MSSKGWGCCWENNWTAILKPALSCKLALVWSFPTVATKSALGKRSDYHTRLLSKCRSTVLKQWGNFSHLSAAKVVFIYARCSTHISHVSNPCITCHSATCFTVGSITHRIFVNSFFFKQHTYIHQTESTDFPESNQKYQVSFLRTARRDSKNVFLFMAVPWLNRKL